MIPPFFKRLIVFPKRYSAKDKRLISSIYSIAGSKPINLDLYKLATQHTSVAVETAKGVKQSNERLEYLGDAVLGMVVADYLFKRFPYKNEGFLTEIRSRIVNRESLNQLARKMGINDIVEYDDKKKTALTYKSLYGDALEAFIGAVYLDKGYHFCKNFILKRLINTHLDLDDIIRTNPNYKSRVIEWAQKENKEVSFEMVQIKGDHHRKEFTARLFIDEEPIAEGRGFSKKKAEQDAAEKSITILKIE